MSKTMDIGELLDYIVSVEEWQVGPFDTELMRVSDVSRSEFDIDRESSTYNSKGYWMVTLDTTRGKCSPEVKLKDERVCIYGVSSNYSGQFQKWARRVAAAIVLATCGKFHRQLVERNT